MAWRYDRPRVLFRVAAGPRIGFGHLVRAASLARAMGVRPVLSVRGSKDGVDLAGRLGACVPGNRRAASVLRERRPDVLVIDDPAIRATRSWRRAARGAHVPTVSIHDLGIGLGDADLVVDGSVRTEGGARSFARLAPAAADPLLQGPRYAILNPACAGMSSPPRPGASSVRRVVIALGGGNRRRLGLDVARGVCRRAPDVEVCIAGGFVPGRQPRADRRVRWIPPSRFGPVLRTATVAVVGGGVTLYEACSLGLPTIAVAVVASQRPTVEAFASAGAAIDGGGFDETGSRLAASVDVVVRRAISLLTAPADRRILSRKARQLVDGRGASRVASAVVGLIHRRRRSGGVAS